MNKSINTLVIREIQTEVERNNYYIQYKTTAKAEIHFNCRITGKKFAVLRLSSDGSSPNGIEALRRAIENFFNFYRTEVTMDYYDVVSESVIDRESLHHVKYDWINDDNIKSVFDQMFSKDELMKRIRL